ncbi:MAG: methyltransferase domain-containing protein [Agriterribacter sp.]
MLLSRRSYKKELLDSNDIPFEDIKQNMKELDFINTWLGGHAITIAGLKKTLTNVAVNDTINICEIGCGGGDNLLAIDKWAAQQGMRVRLTGIDKKKECIDFAKEKIKDDRFSWLCTSYEKTDMQAIKPHIIFSSLFCHHFNEQELVYMMQWMQQNSSVGFFINDLHRHVLAFYSIKMLTALFSKSYLVKNDAPLSVQRGLSKSEWKQILGKANIQQYTIQWKWAFRWLITGK